MSSSNSSEQSDLDLIKESGSKNSPTTVAQTFLNMAFEYKKLKQALKIEYKKLKQALTPLANNEDTDLKNWCFLLQNINQVGNKYELTFFHQHTGDTRIIETTEPVFYSFKQTFNNALIRAKAIDEPFEQSNRNLMGAFELVVDSASWATAIQTLIEFSNNDNIEEALSSLSTTLQIQTYYGLFQSGLTLGQGAFQITQVLSDLAGNKFVSYSQQIGTKILDAAAKATGSAKTALTVMGKLTSSSLTVITGIFSIGIEIAAIAQLDPGNPQFASSMTSLSFSFISFGLGLTSIFGGSLTSSLAGGLGVPIAGIGIGLGALIQISGQQWENCRRLGEYTLSLRERYVNFLSNPGSATEIDLVDGYVIVKEINLKTQRVQLDTPWLPRFNPSSAMTVFTVSTHDKGDSWENNYKKYAATETNITPKSLPLTKTFSNRVREVILPVLPYYKMHIERVSVDAIYYNRYDAEIMALPMLSGSKDVSWNFLAIGYIIGFTNRPEGAIEYLSSVVRIDGSDQEDILVTPSIEDVNNEGDNKFRGQIRNKLTYEIYKSSGLCTLVVSKYAKYKVTLGQNATLLLDIRSIDQYSVDYSSRKITIDGNSIEVNFEEQEKVPGQVILIDKLGKYQKIYFGAKSRELLWIDSEEYKKATNKLIEDEIKNGINDDLVDSLDTVPIKNALKTYQENGISKTVKCPYGFYFRSENKVGYLDSPGKLPQSLELIKCLPDQVVLRQKVYNFNYSFSEEGLGKEDYFYYVKKDNNSFQIEFSGQPHSQSLGYLINGQLPNSRMRGILKDGCPDCGSGNIIYQTRRPLKPNREPGRCLDCDKVFPTYTPDPNEALHTAFNDLSKYDEVHSLLLAWGRESKGVYDEYVNLVIDACESNFYAEQQKNNILTKLKEVTTGFTTVDGAEKKEALKELYWSLWPQQCVYLRLLLRPDLVDFFLVPFQITRPRLSYNEMLALHKKLRYWSDSSTPSHEYLNYALSFDEHTEFNERSILTIKSIVDISPRVVEELNQDAEKLYRLLTIYRNPPYGSSGEAWKSYIRSVFDPLPLIVAFLDNPYLQPQNPSPQLQIPHVRPTLPIISRKQRDFLFSGLDGSIAGENSFSKYVSVLFRDIYKNEVRDEEEMMQMAQSASEELSILGSTQLANLILTDDNFSAQESVRVYLRLLLRPPVASLLPDLPPGTIEKYLN